MKISKFSAIMFGLMLMFATHVGCDTQTADVDSKETESAESPPNPILHKPKKFSSAVERLSEIHDLLMTSDSFPSPRKIDYVDVYHGDETSGHSHYYLASEYEESGGVDEHEGFLGEEGEMQEKVTRRVLEVELRTELTDLVGWLPSIAAKSDISESDWETVSSVSKALTGIIESIPADSSNAAFQDAWKKKSAEIEAQLTELQGAAAATDGKAE